MATRQFLLIFLAALFISFVAASSRPRNPLQFLAKVEQPVILKPRNKITAFSSFDLKFSLYQSTRKIRLALEPSYDVIASDAVVNYLGPDGRIAHSEPIDRQDHHVFKGTAFSEEDDGSWSNVGWARIMVYQDGPQPLFEGTFTHDHDHHHIQLSSTYMRTKHALDPDLESANDEHMLVYRDSDISSNPNGPATSDNLKRDEQAGIGCAADLLMFNRKTDHPVFRDMMRSSESQWGLTSSLNPINKRDGIDTVPGTGNAGVLNFTQTIGKSWGCPTTKKVALVGIATDCGYTNGFATNQTLRKYIINVVNQASSVWENTFNISLGLHDLTVSPKICPGRPERATPWNRACDSGLTLQDRLNLFSAWRGTQDDQNSHWTLMTECQQDGEIGLAWLGQACVKTAETTAIAGGGSETVSGANVVARTGTEWQVFAHETGHTFGAVHDCEQQTCQEKDYVDSGQCCPFSSDQCSASYRYIMNPFTLNTQTGFSQCTLGNICGAIGRNSVNTACLVNNDGVTTITGHECGNGIVEKGEECDCGGVQGCGDDPCCDPTTCKYINGAVCDDANDDCCRGCQFASKDLVCRPSTGSCDPEEKCPGDKATCPRNILAPNGQKCSIKNPPPGAGDFACASGQCTSRNYQCQTQMGAYTHNSNQTYACDDNTCTLSCGSPLFPADTCYNIPRNMLDGTPCGGGGHCRNGQCDGSSFGGEIANWMDQHKNIVIGVAVSVGVILLIVIGSCICGCVRRRKQRKQLAKLGPPQMPMPSSAWYGPSPYSPGSWRGGPGVQNPNVPFQREEWGHASQQGWRPPSGLYGGGILGSRGPATTQQPLYPPPPPPSHFTGVPQSSPRYA